MSKDWIYISRLIDTLAHTMNINVEVKKERGWIGHINPGWELNDNPKFPDNKPCPLCIIKIVWQLKVSNLEGVLQEEDSHPGRR
jgi:hypothetical protein